MTEPSSPSASPSSTAEPSSTSIDPTPLAAAATTAEAAVGAASEGDTQVVAGHSQSAQEQSAAADPQPQAELPQATAQDSTDGAEAAPAEASVPSQPAQADRAHASSDPDTAAADEVAPAVQAAPQADAPNDAQPAPAPIAENASNNAEASPEAQVTAASASAESKSETQTATEETPAPEAALSSPAALAASSASTAAAPSPTPSSPTVANAPAIAAASKPVLPPKKFSSINVTKKFLEKAGASGPQSPALGSSGAPGTAPFSDGLNSKGSAASVRLADASSSSSSPAASPVVGAAASDAAQAPISGSASTAAPASSKLVTAPSSTTAAASPGLGAIVASSGSSALRTRSPAAQASEDGHRATPSPSAGVRHAVLSVKSTSLSTSTGAGASSTGAAGAAGATSASKAPWANLVSGTGNAAQPATSTASATATTTSAATTVGGGSAARFATSLAGGSRAGYGPDSGDRYGGGSGRWGDRGYGGYEDGYRPRDLVPGPSAFPPLGSDSREFPTAAEAKLRQREKEARGGAAAGSRKQNAAAAAAAAAASAAANEDALRSLDRFRGESLSGNRWDDLLGDGDDSDDDAGALFGKDGVVDFGDGQVYRIDPQEAERLRKEKEQELEREASRREEAQLSKWGRLKESERIPSSSGKGLAGPGGIGRAREASADTDRDGPVAPVSKEERFADVNHDRSWPAGSGGAGAAGSRRRDSAFSSQHDDSAKTPSGRAPAAPWGPLAIAQGKLPRPNAPAAGGSTAQPTAAAGSALANRKVSFGQEGSAPAELAASRAATSGRPVPPHLDGGARSAAGRAPAAAAAAAEPASGGNTAPAAAPAARLWGPLAQRAASLGFGPAPQSAPAAAAPAPARAAAPNAAAAHSAAAPAPVVEIARKPVAANTSDRPLPPHLLGRSARPVSTLAEREQRRTDDVDASGHRAPPPPVSGADTSSRTAPQAETKPLAEVQHQEMISAAERARKRREEEEAQRAAERERARLKALALEQKLEAERAEKERAAKVKAEAEAAAARKKQEEYAAAAERRKKEQQEAAERKRRTAEEAQARALAKKEEEAQARERTRLAHGQEGAQASQAGPVRREVGVRQDDGPAQGQAAGARRASAAVSASLEQATWRRAAAPTALELPKASPETAKATPAVSILPRSRHSDVDPSSSPVAARSPVAEKAPPTKSPAPPTPSTEASTWRRKEPLPPANPPSDRERQPSSRGGPHAAQSDASTDAYKSSLDDIISRIKGAIHSAPGTANQTVVSLPSKRFPQRAVSGQPRKSPLDAVDVVTVGDDVLGLTKGGEKRARVRFGTTITTTFGKGTVPKVPDRSLLSETRALRSSLASRLLRPMGGLAGAPKEPLTTRGEVSFDAAPVWNRFSVKIKPSRPAPYLSRQQMQAQRAALANANIPPRPIYPLSWDPPLLTLPIKTLNRDDHFFPKKFQQGKVITLVQLPRQRFAKFLGPAKVSSVIAPSIRDPYFMPQTAVEPLLDQHAHRKGKHKVPQKTAPVVRLPNQGQRSASTQIGQGFEDGTSKTASSASQPVQPPLQHGQGLQYPSSTLGLHDVRAGERGSLPSDMHSHAPAEGTQALPSQPAPHRTAPNGVPTFIAPKPYASPKGRKDSFSGVAFSKTPFGTIPPEKSPVEFMVNSELEGSIAQGRDLPPHLALAKDSSRSATSAKLRTVVSNTAATQPSALPSPGRHSTAFQVWGFPSSGAVADGVSVDPSKSVWTFQASKDDNDVQKALRAHESEFMGPSMSLSIHDLRTEGGTPAVEASRSAAAVQASKSFPRFSGSQSNSNLPGQDSSGPHSVQAAGGASIATTAANSPMLHQTVEAAPVRAAAPTDYGAASQHGAAQDMSAEGLMYAENGATRLQSSPTASRSSQTNDGMRYASSSFNGTSYGAGQYQRYGQTGGYPAEPALANSSLPAAKESGHHTISAYASAFQPASASSSRFYAEQKPSPVYSPHANMQSQTTAAMPSPAGSWPSPVTAQARLVGPANWSSNEQQGGYRWQGPADTHPQAHKYGMGPAGPDYRQGQGVPNPGAAAYSPQQHTYGLYGGAANAMGAGAGAGQQQQQQQRMYGGDARSNAYGLEGRAPIGSLSQHLSPQMMANARYPQQQQQQQQQQFQQQQYSSYLQAQGPQQSAHVHQQQVATRTVAASRYGQPSQQQQQQQQQQQHHHHSHHQQQQQHMMQQHAQQHYQQAQQASHQHQQHQQASQLGQANYAYFHDPSASFW
ncbi:hypothetical protein OC844_006257 [Tilletia horrida]|nr:hypothetical protein OC844_006257 [Tilletia horrida]